MQSECSFCPLSRKSGERVRETRSGEKCTKKCWAINRTCRVLLGFDIINVHSLRHGAHFQLPRSLGRRIAVEQLIADLDARLIFSKAIQRQGLVERIHCTVSVSLVCCAAHQVRCLSCCYFFLGQFDDNAFLAATLRFSSTLFHFFCFWSFSFFWSLLL